MLVYSYIVYTKSLLALIVFAQNFPSCWTHEPIRLIISVFCHFSHSWTWDEIKIFFWGSSWSTKELHFLILFVICSNFERKDLNSIQQILLWDQKFLSMPVIIQVNIIQLRMLDASRVSPSNEVSDSRIYSGRCMPQNFIWTTVKHWRRPNCKYSMILVQSSIIKQSLVLSHPVV